MITEAIGQTNTWQEQLQTLITDPVELCQRLDLPVSAISRDAAQAFALRIPRRMLDKIEPGNPNDPILRQFLPEAAELNNSAGYTNDPLQEQQFSPAPGLIHKYHGRVLITASGQCAINCRYCFRRHFPYLEHRVTDGQWQQIVDYLAATRSINEVIFSGGDPLSISNRQLQHWLESLSQLNHITRIRLHTRLPAVIPARIDTGLIEVLKNWPGRVVFVLHVNHPRELDQELAQALALLADIKVMLLNQSVLLKGVNDQPETLVELSEKLFDLGVTPYYLHMLDKVAGAEAFSVPKARAQKLHLAMQNRLPGFLVPRLVCETPGHGSKTWVNE